MRQSVRSSSTSLNSNTRARCITVVLLNREELTVSVEGKAKVQDVFNQVCEHLSLRETEYFGLAKVADEEFQFCELTSKLHKHVPKSSKSWRPQKQEERQGLTLYFRVQYYVEHVSLLKERVTRQLYYQQLKDNLLHYSQEVSEDKCFLLAAFSLQSDIGNYVQEKHNNEYFDPREYFPAWVVDKHGNDYIRSNMPMMHQDCNTMPKQQAQMSYIRELSKPPTQHNMHMYRLKKQKQENPGSVWVAVCPQGVHIYQDERKFRILLSTFQWGDIGRLHFEKKKFEIQPSGSGEPRKFRYYTGSDERGKFLLHLCQSSHQFQMGMAPKLAEQKQYEAEDRRYRESYIYSDNVADSSSISRGSGMFRSKLSISRCPGRTSTTSSQTTSGIASEKLHTSLDESEDTDEILINSPPQANPRTLHKVSPAASVKTRTSSLGLSGQFTNISRTSSAHSQHSGALSAVAYPLTPADTHIQKMTFAPTMTVTSHSVNPRMGSSHEVMNGPHTGVVQQQGAGVGGYVFPQQALPQPQHLQPVTSNQMPIQPQFAEPLIPRTPSDQQTRQHTVRTPTDPLPRTPTDHTYANMETLSPAMYTQASPNSTGPLTSTPYASPQDHTLYLPATHPPPVSRARDFIVNRPNRSYSQVTPPVKVQYPPQRAVSNADAYITKRPTRVDCPIHGLRHELFREIQVKSHRRKDLPLLQALCQDRFFQQKQCTCEIRTGDHGLEGPDGAAGHRRFSYSSASTPDLYNHPGTVVRPVSWHEPTHIDPNTLQVFGTSINIDDQQQHQPHHQLQQTAATTQFTTNHILDNNNQPSSTLFTQNHSPPNNSLTYSTGAFHRSMESLDYPTMLTYQYPQDSSIGNSMVGQFPSRLLSGGLSGSQSVDNLLQSRNYTLGVATS